MSLVKEFVMAHMSTKPWSDYTEADYTLPQWHDACLIHIHNGPDYTKADCKLPVKTPDGTVNQNGVFAAAAALAGARTPLQAPQSEKVKAAKELVKLYGSMNKKPPDSLMNMTHGFLVEEFLSHYGDSVPMDSSSYLDKRDAQEIDWNTVAISLISCIVSRVRNDPTYSDVDLNKNTAVQKQYDGVVEKLVNDRLVSMGILSLNKIDDNAFVYALDRKAGMLFPTMLDVMHQKDISDCVIFYVNFDDKGFIVGIKPDLPKEETPALLFQSDMKCDELVDAFVSHHGVKGQRWGVRNKPHKQGPSKDAKRASTSLKKSKRAGVKVLTNKELKDLTQRMELERKYNQGLPQNAVKKGKSHAKTILAAIGITSAASIPSFLKSENGQKIVKMLQSPSGKHYPKPPVVRFGKHGVA